MFVAYSRDMATEPTGALSPTRKWQRTEDDSDQSTTTS